MDKKLAKKQKEKKAIKVQTWKIIVTTYEDGSSNMERINDGFYPLELIGISDFVAWEVKEQMMGRIIPDTIQRKVMI